MKPINLQRELSNNSYWLSIVKRYVDNDKSFLGIDSIENMQQHILTHKWGYPKRILIPKPNGKMREIFSFNYRDAFYQKVIGSILYSKFNPNINSNVFSYREGIRVSDGARHIQPILNSNCYGLKLDISNYFLSINQSEIFKTIDSLIEDDWGRNLLKQLFSLNAYIDNNGNVIKKYLSIMPGCAISSFLANYMLKDIDEYLTKNTLKYARYSDDLIYFTNTESEMNDVLDNVKSLISKLGLSINPNKVEVVKRGNAQDEVVFLGLAITGNSIDLSKKAYKEIRHNIKSIIIYCKGLFYLNDKYSKKSKDYQLQFAIYKIYKYLYNVSINNSKYTSIMQYAFTNITQYKNLIELDFYIKDRLRQLYTGKNNKANAYKCSTYKLEQLGYKPVMWFYNMYKTDRELFLTETQVLIRQLARGLFEREYVLHGNIPIRKCTIGNLREDKSAFNFIKYMTTEKFNIGKIIDGKMHIVNIENLHIDFEEHKVYLLNDPIIDGNKLISDNLYIISYSKSQYIAYKVAPTELYLTEYDKFMLIYHYINCFSNYSTRSKWFNKESMEDIPLRDFNLNYVSKMINTSNLQTDKPYVNRKYTFLLLLYFAIVTNEINGDLVKLSNKYVTRFKLQINQLPAIILPESWISTK